MCVCVCSRLHVTLQRMSTSLCMMCFCLSVNEWPIIQTMFSIMNPAFLCFSFCYESFLSSLWTTQHTAHTSIFFFLHLFDFSYLLFWSPYDGLSCYKMSLLACSSIKSSSFLLSQLKMIIMQSRFSVNRSFCQICQNYIRAKRDSAKKSYL